MKTKHTVVIMGLVIMMMILSPPAESVASSSLYNKFDRWITNFDPLGKALAPVNRIPNLKVDGMLYNTSLWNVDRDGKYGYVDRDWRYQEIQWIGELGVRYQVAPRAEMVSRFQYMYDSVYDWQRSNLYADEIDTDSYKLPGDHFLREFHLDLESDKWFVKIGKQNVIWGKMEGRWMDFINNLEAKDGPQIRGSAYNQLRIPLWMADATYSFGKSSLEFIWIPDYEPERTTYPGSPWWMPMRPDPSWDPTPIVTEEEPGMESFEDHQAAVRLDTKLGAATWSLGYMYGYSKTPSKFVRLDENEDPYYSMEYTRSHYFGTAVDYSYLFRKVPVIRVLPFAVRFEAFYQTDVNFTDYAEWNPRTLTLMSGDGLTETDLVSGAAQFKVFLPGRIYAYYQPSYSRYLGWEESLGLNQKSLSHLLFINKTFPSLDNRLSVTGYSVFLTGKPVNEWQGSRHQLIIGWYFSDNLELNVMYTDYFGISEDYFGQYDHYDNAGFELKYTF
jgi:hypothetical protein